MTHVLTRREAIAAGVGLAFTADAAAGFKPENIDTHIHLYDPTRPGGVPWPGKDDKVLYKPVLPADFKKVCGKITGAIIVEASPRVEDNQWLLDLIKGDKFFDGVVGRLLPDDEDFATHLARFAKNPLFRGIRWNANEVAGAFKAEAQMDRIKALADAGLTLDVNGGPEVLALAAKLADKLPKLRIVINHMGNVPIDGKEPPAEWLKGLKAAGGRDNVWCKMSGHVDGTGKRGGKAPADLAFYKPVFDAVWDAFGTTKLLFGSNWPVSDHYAPFGTVFNLVEAYLKTKGIDPQIKVLGDNPTVAYRLDRK